MFGGGLKMNLPVRCVHCNTIFSSGLILPPEYIFKNKVQTIANASDAPMPICPHCGKSSGPESQQESGDLLRALMGMSLSGAELAKLRAALFSLNRTEISEEATRNMLAENPKARGIARMIPEGQANVIAFLALAVALLTLLESAIADWPSLSKFFSPESRGKGSTPSSMKHTHSSQANSLRNRISLDHPKPGSILHPDYYKPTRWDGQLKNSPGYVLCSIYYEMRVSSRKRFYKLHETSTTNEAWYIETLYRSQFAKEYKSLRNFFVMGFLKQRTWDRLADRADYLSYDGVGDYFIDAAVVSFVMIHPACMRFWVIPIAPRTSIFVGAEYLPEVRIPLSLAFD
jgi:hypothetical protein